MATQTINWCTDKCLNCDGSIPADGYLCLSPAVVRAETSQPFAFIPASITAVRASTKYDSCGTCKHVYTVTYDDTLVVDDFVLAEADIHAVLCKNCLVSFVLDNTTPCWTRVSSESELIAANTAAVGGILVVGEITLTADITVSIPIDVSPCGVIITDGFTLTIDAPFTAGLTQCFDSAVGEVVFGKETTQAVYPQWFGAIADGTTDCNAEVNTALASVAANGGTVHMLPGSYLVTNTLNINGSGISFTGDNAELKFNNQSYGVLIMGAYGANIENILVKNLRLTQLYTNSSNGSQQALQTDYVDHIRVQDCKSTDWAVGFKFNTATTNIWVERNYFYNLGEAGVGGIGVYVEGDDGDTAETYDNNKVFILNNHVDTCIYGCECKFVQDFVIDGNIVENTHDYRYGILAVRDTGAGDESITQRGVITNNIVRNCLGEGIFVKGINIVVANNVVENADRNAYHLAGLNIVMSNNIAYNCFGAASIVYDAGAVTGGGLPSELDSAKFTVTNNLFMLITGTDPALSFNECSDSLIMGNCLWDYQGVGANAYGYKFVSCVNTRVLDNFCDGGIYGYRIETSSTGLTWRNNKAQNTTNYGTDIPGAYPGWTIDDGDYQSKYLARIQTTDATPTNIRTFSVTASDSSVHLRAMVNCKTTGGAGVVGAYDVEVYVKRGGGALSIVGSVGTLFSAESDPALDATWVVSGTNVSLQVTGLAGTNLNWSAVIDKIDTL